MKKGQDNSISCHYAALFAADRTGLARRVILFRPLITAFFVLTCLLTVTLSEAAESRDELWSFSFEDLTVSEAVDELTALTGVDIYSNKPFEDRRLSKSYQDQTIERILRDIIRGENYTLQLNYGEKGLESVGVRFFGGSGSRGSSGRFSSRSETPAVERDADRTVRRTTPRRPRPKPAVRRPASTAGRTTPSPSEPDEDQEESEDLSESDQPEEDLTTPPEPEEDETSEGEPPEEDDASETDLPPDSEDETEASQP